MLIKVLKTTLAATDKSGYKTKEYKKDSIEDIHNELAKVFIAEGWGESVIEKKSIQDIEDKSIKEDKIDNKSFLQKNKNFFNKKKKHKK